MATLLVAGLAAMGASACQRAPSGAGTEVKALSFDGNRAFKDSQLAAQLATRKSGWLPWSRKRFFNQRTFDADLIRLKAFYADRGYPDAHVTGTDVEFNDKHTEVRLAIHLDEGEPVIVEHIQFQGLQTFAPQMLDAVSNVPIKEGAPRDRVEINTSRDRALFVLRDRGYPNAHVELTETQGSTPKRAVLTFQVDPGPAATFGEISITTPPKNVSNKVIFRSLSFKPGGVYRESQVLDSQRRLASLGVFEFAHVAPAPVKEGEAPPTLKIPMAITVTEAKTTRTQFGVGYGSEDGPRGSFLWRNLNFMRDARQFTADAKYSRRLKSVTIDLVEPYLGHAAVSGAVGVGGAIFDEDTYTSRSYGGRASITWRPRVGRGLHLEPIDHVVRLAYRNESLEYEIKPDTLDDLTQFDDLIALGFDPTTGSGSGRVGSLDLDLERTQLDSPLNMTRGHFLSLHLEHAATWLGGTYQYTEILGEGRIYIPISAMVWANRVRAGALIASEPDLIPFSSRYFLGGSTSLRGWGRFQVAPLTEDGLPIGGEKVLEISTELRVPLRGSFGAVVFVDAGNVYSNNASISIEHLRVSVGPGIRWTSPVGVVRADLGIQLNPIPGLMIDGQPETRHWRIHFSIGHTF